MSDAKRNSHKIMSSQMNRRGRRRRRRPGPAVVFFLTLFLLLSVGIAGILLFKYLSPEDAREASALPKNSRETGIRPIWENISEEVENLKNTGGEIEGGAKEETEKEARYADELSDEAYMAKNNILPWEGKDKGTVTLGFVGDILLDDEYAIMANLLNRGGTIDKGISQSMLTEMRGVDILVANNEFPFTDRGTPTEEKTFTFRADTDAVSYLKDMGVDVAVLANNHIYDFGEVGLLDTLDTLAGAEISRIGAGRNLEEASAPLYFIVNDMKIALVAATQIERLDNPDTKGATENSPGVFRCLDPEKLYQVVAKAKENSDFVIVYIHWGTENVPEPDWAQLDQGPGLAKAGADLIIGDHPHCLQGITYFGDTPVIYSMGNFWFNSKTVDTGMVKVVIGQEGLLSFQFLPALQSGCRVDLAYGEDKERILSYMRNLSPDVLIDEDGFVDKNRLEK